MNTRLYARLTAVLLAMLLLFLPVLAWAEAESDGYTDTEAMDEEDISTVEKPNVGDYEWYMLPSDVEEGHAYVDIYPSEETVTVDAGKCTFTFVLEETNGYDFTITSVLLIGFIDDEEVTRESLPLDEVAAWCPDLRVDANAIVYYTDTIERDGLTAVAVSVIGTDSTDEEMEFHSIVFIEE